MSIASMTGFAREAGSTGPAHWAWELKSVNGRGLEVRVRVPAGLDSIGEEARTLVQKRLGRGTCHLTLTLSRAEAAPRVRINEALLASLAEAVTRVPMPLGITLPSVDGLLGIRGVVEVDEETADDEALRHDLAAAAARLVDSLVEGRRAEGRALADIVGRQLVAMADHVEAAEACPARRPEAVKARLSAQVAGLIEAGSLDPARLHQEAVLLAARADVREEIDRLRAHLSAARDLLAAGGAVGRRLDFLAQELGREANTLCAKANDVSLSRIGLDLKAVVEQFREQVQNVE